MTLAEKLKLLREERGITQKQMATKLSMGQSSYSRLEAGRIALKAELLPLIADALNINIRELFE